VTVTFETDPLENPMFAQDLCYTQQDFRRMNGAVVSTSGVMLFDAFQVQGTGLGLEATVNSGGAWIRADSLLTSLAGDEGPLFVYSTDTETVEFSANASGSVRIDLVAIRVCDAQYAPVASEFTIVVIEGTPGAGTPTVPADSCVYYVLASVSIASGETIIAGAPSFYGLTDDDITDTRYTYQMWTNVCPYVELVASAGTSIAANMADTKVNLATTVHNETDPFFIVAASVVTVNFAGLYDIHGAMTHGAVASPEAVEAAIWKNGLAGTRIARTSCAASNADGATMALNPSIRRVALVEGDTIQLTAAQSSGGAVTSVNAATTRLLIEKVG
jgi:hypothetical protein